MTYEIRYQYRMFSLVFPFHVLPWEAPRIKTTRYWWRVRLAAWTNSLYSLVPAPPGSLIGLERRLRVRIKP